MMGGIFVLLWQRIYLNYWLRLLLLLHLLLLRLILVWLDLDILNLILVRNGIVSWLILVLYYLRLLCFASLIIRILLCDYFRRVSIVWSILRGDKSRIFLKSVVLIYKRSCLRLYFFLVFNTLSKVHIELHLLINLRSVLLFII